jgi:hypothetical protein
MTQPLTRTPWKPDLESLKIVLLSIGAAVAYGVVHVGITARVCVELYTVGGPPIFQTTDPIVLAFGLGILGTLQFGFIALGAPLVLVGSLGSRPRLAARDYVKPLAVLLLWVGSIALLAGFLGYRAAQTGALSLPRRYNTGTLPKEKRELFLAVWTAGLGAVGAACWGIPLLWMWAWVKRGRLQRSLPATSGSPTEQPRVSQTEGQVFWGGMLAAVVPFQILLLYLALTRWPKWSPEVIGDAVPVSLCFLVGMAGIAILPHRTMLIRVLLVCLYVPALAFVLLIFALYFAGSVYDLWL